MNNKENFWTVVGHNTWFLLVIVVMIVALASKGCVSDDSNGSDTNVRVSSVGNIALLTSEPSGAQNDFGPVASDAVYVVDFTGGVGIVTSSVDLEVIGDTDVEVWEVIPDEVTEFETIIRTYLTYEGWVPDLFPASYGSAGDLEAMLTVFSCVDGIDMSVYAPFECPDEYIPDTLFRRVDDEGYYYWQNDGATKVVFLVKR